MLGMLAPPKRQDRDAQRPGEQRLMKTTMIDDLTKAMALQQMTMNTETLLYLSWFGYDTPYFKLSTS